MENENIQVEEVTKDYSTLSLVFGILSIVLSCCTGIFTFLFGLAATILGKKTMNGDTEQKKGKPGFICGIIGMVISTLVTVLWIVYLVVIGVLTFIYNDFDYSALEQYEIFNSFSGYSEDATYENFITLELGMNIKEVEGILGKGLDTGGGDFEWKNDIGYIKATFDPKDRLVYMSQVVSEWEEDPAITQELEGKISMGMSIDEVVAILGEGRLFSAEFNGGVTYKSYTWNGLDMSIYVDFENDKVINIYSMFY